MWWARSITSGQEEEGEHSPERTERHTVRNSTSKERVGNNRKSNRADVLCSNSKGHSILSSRSVILGATRKSSNFISLASQTRAFPRFPKPLRAPRISPYESHEWLRSRCEGSSGHQPVNLGLARARGQGMTLMGRVVRAHLQNQSQGCWKVCSKETVPSLQRGEWDWWIPGRRVCFWVVASLLHWFHLSPEVTMVVDFWCPETVKEVMGIGLFMNGADVMADSNLFWWIWIACRPLLN